MCSRGCAKVLLGIFNVLFFLSGILLLAFGIASIVDPEGVTRFLSHIPGVDSMVIIINIPDVIISSAVFMIVLGSLMFVFGFLGCVGAWCSVKPVLFFYWLLLLVLILAEVALIIYAAVMPEAAKTRISDVMYTSLHQDFEPVSINATAVTLPSDVVALSWVSMQFEVGCCGVHNSTDYENFSWNNTFYIPQHTVAKVPPSCCVTRSKDVPKSTSEFVDLSQCLNGVDYYHKNGCHMAVVDLARQYSYIPIGICSCVIAIEFVCMMAAIFLWRSKDDSPKV
jgi:CD63 antigen